MSEGGKSSGSQNSYAYGTFQGVANYYNPPPPQPLPLPVFNVASPRSAHSTPFYHGYQTLPVTVNAIEVGRPVRDRLPCCGLGISWLFFVSGFFFGGIPWYIGTFILLLGVRDHREKPGYIACAIASIILMVTITLGLTTGSHDWKALHSQWLSY